MRRLAAATLTAAIVCAASSATAGTNQHDPGDPPQHTCKVQGGTGGKCINWGHRLWPRYTSSGYINGCIQPQGSEMRYFVIVFTNWVGHQRVQFLTPIKASQDFRTAEGVRKVDSFSNQRTEHGPRVGYGIYMINDADPPGLSWQYSTIVACLFYDPNCGCKDRQIARQESYYEGMLATGRRFLS